MTVLDKWFLVVKKDGNCNIVKEGDSKQPTTEQTKLPESITSGATVSDLTADEWFTPKGKRKLARKKKPVTTPTPAAQSTLDAFSNKKPTE